MGFIIVTEKKISDPQLNIGMKCEVLRGINHTNYAQWMEKGDIVAIVGLYEHYIMVERPYKSDRRPQYKLRECFCRNNWKRYLKVIE